MNILHSPLKNARRICRTSIHRTTVAAFKWFRILVSETIWIIFFLSEMIKLSSPFWLLSDFEITLWIMVLWESHTREASQEITSLLLNFKFNNRFKNKLHLYLSQMYPISHPTSVTSVVINPCIYSKVSKNVCCLYVACLKFAWTSYLSHIVACPAYVVSPSFISQIIFGEEYESWI